jgi:hypothetical protein
MGEELGQAQTFGHVKTVASTAPYFSARCGEIVTRKEDVAPALHRFMDNILTYDPAAYVTDTLTPKAVYRRYWKPVIEYIMRASGHSAPEACESDAASASVV